MLAGDVMMRQEVIWLRRTQRNAGRCPDAQASNQRPARGRSSGILLGIISEGDFRGGRARIRRRGEPMVGVSDRSRASGERIRHACGRKVTKIMTPNPYTVSEATPLDRTRGLMEAPSDQARARAVCGTPVGLGIVSRADLSGRSQGSRRAETVPTNDAEIRGARDASCASRAGDMDSRSTSSCVIRTVDLQGTITDDSVRQAMVVGGRKCAWSASGTSSCLGWTGVGNERAPQETARGVRERLLTDLY